MPCSQVAAHSSQKPRPLGPLHVPVGLARDVAGPDHEALHEGDVGPKENDADENGGEAAGDDEDDEPDPAQRPVPAMRPAQEGEGEERPDPEIEHGAEHGEPGGQPERLVGEAGAVAGAARG